MLKLSVLILFFATPLLAAVPARLPALEADEKILREDVALIITHAKLPAESLALTFQSSATNTTTVSCRGKQHTLTIAHTPGERAATTYHALRKLGFLFPHPRWQISPATLDRKACGKSFTWKPALKFRGHHLHTLHPNEAMHAFFTGREDIALEYIRWLARNHQNLLDVSLLRVPLRDIQKNFAVPFKLARNLGIHTGVSLGVALQQQKSYKLIGVWRALTGIFVKDRLKEELQRLLGALDLSFIVLEAGTSEFTPTSYARTRDWLNLAAKTAAAYDVQLFTKVHVSTNQHDAQWGNYNFLPRHAEPNVGILPHTVMFYGLLDRRAPMYGNRDFRAIREFMWQEMGKRPTWYYPETGYWVGMDVDVPLFLTDYLVARAQDLRLIHLQGVEGQLNFSTGLAMGGWLFDWNLSLLTDLDLGFDPLAGLKLLGEDVEGWKQLLHFQNTWFKQRGVIALVSSANFQDEISARHRIHDRHTMKELSENPTMALKEMALLQETLDAWPTVTIRDPHLASLLAVTRLRVAQARELRRALAHPTEKAIALAESKRFREEAKLQLALLLTDGRNYPDAHTFTEHENPTSYPFGYVWPAASLHFWEREERMIAEDSYWPFKMNIYDFRRILF